jgi:hypothetical protein
LEKNLRRRKQEILQKKLNEMELKLVVPEQKNKLVFFPHSERSGKPTFSKYNFMDLLEMRAKGK